MNIEIERIELAARLRALRDEEIEGRIWISMRCREARRRQNALILQACDALAAAPIITIARFELFMAA